MKRIIIMLPVLTQTIFFCACSKEEKTDNKSTDTGKESIEKTLNLSNNDEQEWTYTDTADAWVLSVVSAVALPELLDQQGVSVCVPGAYVKGIDTDSDGTADVTADSGTDAVKGSLVMDNDGNTCYTGDAPSCLVDQKAAARYVKYNILFGNLPGSVDYFVSTGGSGGGAHATMFAATSNNPDFYDYQIEAGAVGVYKNDDGGYSTTVSIGGKDYEPSDGAWGCIAYSAITSLYEADMVLAFEYYMDTTYKFNTSFQSQLAEYLSAAYMEYINEQKLSVTESAVGFDLNKDGDLDDTIALTIEYDEKGYSETNGYYGMYLDLYLAEFTENLQWYLDNLDYAEGRTWFDKKGNALSDKEVAAMTSEDKAKAFIEGRYTKGSSGKGGGGMHGDGMPGGGATDGEKPSGNAPSGEKPAGNMSDGGMPSGEKPDGNMSDGGMPTVEKPDGNMSNGENTDGNMTDSGSTDGNRKSDDGKNKEMEVGTPDEGTTQSATGNVDSANYESYEDMVAAYKADIEKINSGDKYGKNIVSLYNPLNYIGADKTENPTWTKIVMGASEGDMSMLASLNMQIAWLNASVDSVIEWQWDGGHVPSEILGNSLSLCVDQMYGEYVDGAEAVTKQKVAAQTENGTATEMSGTDISSMVRVEDVSNVSFSLADAAKYRTRGASKATPAFDVIDYGQEDYVFGDTETDARHWNKFLLEILEKNGDILQPLFNAN